MKRRNPKQDRSKEKVERIIQASARIISKEGFANFTTNKVAKEAKIGVASIYEYFEDKDDIVLKVIEYEVSGFMKRLENMLPDLLDMDFDPAVRTICTFVVKEVTAKSEFIRVIAGHMHGASDIQPMVMFFGRAEMIIRMFLVKYSVDSAHDRSLDAFLVTHALAGICTGIANGMPMGTDQEQFVDRMVDVSRHLVGRETI